MKAHDLVVVIMLLAFSMFVPSAFAAQTLQDGADAFKNGDYAKAASIWRPLAEQGNASAQSNLGSLYLLGRGVSRDPVEAVKWLALASRNGNVSAEHNLAQAYAHGDGVPLDNSKAAELFLDAAKKGSVPAQAAVGFNYDHGLGMPLNPVKAYMWYTLAGPEAPDWAQKNALLLEKKLTTAQIREATAGLIKCRAELKTCS